MALFLYTLAAIAVPLYLLCLSIYRLYFHPLAGIPGPKFAAITGWYETYFELFHKGLGGQYTFHIRELHAKYGPIIRISPQEVHVDDPDFYSTIYTNKQGLDKPDYLKWRFGAPSALFSTPEHHLHRMRRAAQEPFFAKQRIVDLSPVIQAKADKMCSRLAQDFINAKKPVTLDNLFASYVADVTTQYSVDRDFDWLGHAEFESPFVKAIRSLKDIAHPSTQFPWLPRAVAAIPPSIVRVLQPTMSSVLDFQEDMRRLVIDSMRDLDKIPTSKADKTIVHGILRSDMPKEELHIDLLKDHAVSLLGAGVASAQWTLTIAMFHIISDPSVYNRLKDELVTAMPDPNVPISLDQGLENLPYLMACVDEAIRLACGQMTRSPRISKKPITYSNYVLPPGSHISLDTWHTHHNPVLYPRSFSFDPDRWLGDPQAPAPYHNRPLKHYMVSFGKGTRRCIGENLARAEITIEKARE
ncbi:cytochrome P450 [Cladorrhinum sp. PSN332]|nr:cytochrome P450 [Cladorrhinum sp. PSN332]